MMIQRSTRNVALLSMCQAFGQTQMVLIFSVSSIIGATIAPNAGWATVPITFQFIAMTLSTVPAALLMKKIGRALLVIRIRFPALAELPFLVAASRRRSR